MTDTRSIANSQTDSSLSSESEETTRSKSRRNSKDGKKINQRKLAADLLDSNGESEDEEINKLQKTIQDQAKELNDEKLASRKVQISQIMLLFEKSVDESSDELLNYFTTREVTMEVESTVPLIQLLSINHSVETDGQIAQEGNKTAAS